MAEEEKTEQAPEGAPAGEQGAEAPEDAAPAEAEAPEEEPPEAEAPDEAPTEAEAPEVAPAEAAPEEAPAAAADPEAELPWKQRRRLQRSRLPTEPRPPRTAQERQAEREQARRAKAASRRSHRHSRRAKRGEPGTGTLPAERQANPPKVRQGVVVSDRPDKTITVRIDIARRHPAYEKIVRQSRTLHAHDERNEAGAGDVVRVVETRPLSRHKRWRLLEVLEKAR